MTIAENLARVRERIAGAALRAGRNADDIALMAVTKTVEPARIREAFAAGVRVFGENRVQEFAEKASLLRQLGILPTAAAANDQRPTAAAFHMIGHLQANKAAKAAELFAGVDSLDSVRLAERLDAGAARLGRRLRVLIEINIGGEQQKSGVAPDSAELEALLTSAPRLEHLEFAGLMAIPPHTDDPQGARPYFRCLRELRDQIAARNLPRVSMATLSMGMSHDFEVAIEEGSNCVRIGTAIFGERPK